MSVPAVECRRLAAPPKPPKRLATLWPRIKPCAPSMPKPNTNLEPPGVYKD